MTISDIRDVIAGFAQSTENARTAGYDGVEIQAAQRAFAPWLTQVLRDRQGLLLQPNPAADGPLLGVRLPGRPGAAMPVGRGYLVRASASQLVQVRDQWRAMPMGS